MRVVIVANGVIAEPQVEFARWMITADGDLDDDCVIVGANGGTRYLLACGIYPRHVIGDLDSVTLDAQADLQAHGVTFHTYPPQKDKTDLELALVWAASRWPQVEIVILGAMGGRPDQALANLLLLALPELQGRDSVLAEGGWLVRVIRGGETRSFTGLTGDTLSLIPLGGPVKDVTTTGLQYPLSCETLLFGPARGVSNVFLKEEATVTVGDGALWVFYKSEKVI